MVLHHQILDKTWEFIGVYGPADHSLSNTFLDELSTMVEASSLPLLIVGILTCLGSLG